MAVWLMLLKGKLFEFTSQSMKQGTSEVRVFTTSASSTSYLLERELKVTYRVGYT